MLLRPFVAVCITLSSVSFVIPIQSASAEPAPKQLISEQPALMDQAKAAIAEAQALRASEFSPKRFNVAKTKLVQAKELQRSHAVIGEIERLLNEVTTNAKEASASTQQFTHEYARLVESRDRLMLAGDEYIRDDLRDRSEKEFARVVSAFEAGKSKKTKREEKSALASFRAAQVVAGRQQFVSPVAKSIAKARKMKARKYAPKALKNAIKSQTKVERLIKNNPDAQSEAYTLSMQGIEASQHAMRVSAIASKLVRQPANMEAWVDASDARMRMLAESLGLQLDLSLVPDLQMVLFKQTIEDMKTEHAIQMKGADLRDRDLSEKLAKYEGELSEYEGELSEMAEVRRKLQLKREAEAKIKRLTKLFDPEMVEILLTPDADVILRMKKLNFLSGSAVIPPEAYMLLDHAIKSIGIFPNRTARIEGHTDFMGTNEYNQDLSERRANAVRGYLLLQMKQNENRFSAIGHGEEKPIANNETAEGRTKNRRIDIVLIAPSAEAVSKQPPL